MILNAANPSHYAVMEQFYTLQGEGAHAGRAAYFIRLGGCNVGCVWCDVKESWDEKLHEIKSATELVKQISGYNNALVVITGGEPLMHNLSSLTGELKSKGLSIHLETSGSHGLTGDFDWICLSPKKFKEPLPEIFPKVNELKAVIFHKSDFDWAEKYAAQMPATCRLFLQPEWGQSNKMLPLIIDYIQKNPQWQLSLQIHKFIGVP